MRCKDLKYEYLDYVKGKVNEELKTQIEKHIKECVKCRNEIEKMRMLSHELDNYEVQLPDNKYFINFIPKLNEKLGTRESQIKNKKVVSYALSFSTFLSLVVLFFFISQIGYYELPYNTSNHQNTEKYSVNEIEKPSIEEIEPSVINYEHYLTKNLIQKVMNKNVIEQKATQLLASAVIDEHRDEIFSRENLSSLIEELSDEEVDNMINELKTKDILK
jgi:hypothetical protein